MNTLQPLATAYSRWIGRNPGGVASTATPPGAIRSMAFLNPSIPRNCRSGGTSTLPAKFPERFFRLPAKRFSKTSAMATSCAGPAVDSALAAAPVPRPPQPIKAILIVFCSAA